MSTCPTLPSAGTPVRAGFALIMAIGLMALIVLLLVTLSALLSIESTASQQGLMQTLARQNARVALAQAVGVVQEKLGPDRVVTARAEVYGDNAQHPLWTGVWSTVTPSAAPVWLVSGKYSDNDKLLGLDATSPRAFTETVVISDAVSGSSNYASQHNNNNGSVRVGRVPLSTADQYSGGYAWWVSDEGVKASVGVTPSVTGNKLVNPADAKATPKLLRHARQVMQQRAGLEDSATSRTAVGSMQSASLEAEWYSDDDARNKILWLDRVGDVRGLSRLDDPDKVFFSEGSASTEGITWYEHDLTVLSRGVMANPAAPENVDSLKVDLSTALPNTWVQPTDNAAYPGIYDMQMPTAYLQSKWGEFALPLSAYFNLWRLFTDDKGKTLNGKSTDSLLSQVPLIAPLYQGVSLTSRKSAPTTQTLSVGMPSFSTAPVLSEIFFTFAGYFYDADKCLGLLADGTYEGNTCANTSYFCNNANHLTKPMIGTATVLGTVVTITNAYRPFEWRAFGFSEYWNPYTADVMPPASGSFQMRVKGLPKVRLHYYGAPALVDKTTLKEKNWVPFTQSAAADPTLFAYNQSEPLDLQERMKSPAPLEDWLAVDLKLLDTPLALGAGETHPWSGLASNAKTYASDSGTFGIFNTMKLSNNPGYRTSAVYGIREMQAIDYNPGGGARGAAIPNYHSMGLLRGVAFYPEETHGPWIGRVNAFRPVDANRENVRLRFETVTTDSPEKMEVQLWWIPSSNASGDREGVFLSSYLMDMKSAPLDIGPTETGNAEYKRLTPYSLEGRFGWYFLRKDARADTSWLTNKNTISPADLLQGTDSFMFYDNGEPGDIRMDTTSYNQAASWASTGLLDKPSGKLLASPSNDRNVILGAVRDKARVSTSIVQPPERNLGAAVSLFELPTRRPLSMGSLQHLTLTGRRPFAIGNSWGHEAGVASSGKGKDVNALFDDFGVSGLSTITLSELNPAQPMLNHALEPLWTSSGSAPSVSSVDVLSKFLVKGAFNINSTSVAAWRALLSGIWIEQWDNTGLSRNDTELIASEGTPFALKRAHFRQALVADETFQAPEYVNTDSTGVYKDKESYLHPNHFRRGVRSLTLAQVETMAESIVRQIKKRMETQPAPFTSLASFLAPDETSNKSIFEQAIEDSGANENADWDVKGTASAAPMRGSSAYLTQADLMTSLAPVAQVRSDTFKIRAYGDVKGATGQIEAKAVCEAIVQRYPDPAKDGTVQQPGQLGRQFKVLSMRWIND